MSIRDTTPHIAFLGTGAMGAPMARRLLGAGYSVSVWNRTREKADHLAKAGATVSDEVLEAVREAEVVVVMLEDGDAVRHVLFDMGVAEALSPRSTVIDMSSISPAAARENADRLEALGVRHLDAPVSGGTSGAAAGTLAVMVGGAQEDYDRVLDLLSAMGRATYVGPSGGGQVAKLANQIIVGITIGAVAEGLSFARAAGVDPAIARKAMQGGFADSRVLDEHGARMLSRNFESGGAVRLQLKDLITATDTASEIGLELPITSVVQSLYERLSASGHGQLDHAALVLEIEQIEP